MPDGFQRRAREHAEKKRAEHTADTVHAERVEGVIPTKPGLPRDGPIAGEARENANQGRRLRRNIARGWGDRCQARDRTG